MTPRIDAIAVMATILEAGDRANANPEASARENPSYYVNRASKIYDATVAANAKRGSEAAA